VIRFFVEFDVFGVVERATFEFEFEVFGVDAEGVAVILSS
jgi:hypothetical protein